jgi:large subunit ribosomal protein L22
MEIIARSRYIRMSAQKLREVAQKMVGLPPKKAVSILSQLEKRAGRVIENVLLQAMANAQKNFNITEGELKIKKIAIDGGPIYKRWQPVSRGMAHPIKKRTSHITVVLEKKEKEEKKGK